MLAPGGRDMGGAVGMGLFAYAAQIRRKPCSFQRAAAAGHNITI